MELCHGVGKFVEQPGQRGMAVKTDLGTARQHVTFFESRRGRERHLPQDRSIKAHGISEPYQMHRVVANDDRAEPSIEPAQREL